MPDRRAVLLDAPHALTYSGGMHDFRQYILDLEQHSGLSLRGIARKLGCHAATVSDIKQGRTREPKATVGLAIIRMHQRVMRGKV